MIHLFGCFLCNNSYLWLLEDLVLAGPWGDFCGFSRRLKSLRMGSFAFCKAVFIYRLFSVSLFLLLY